MRIFHIFNINPYVENLTKDDAYPLFQSFLKIKNMSKKDLSMGINIYEQIAIPIEKDRLNKKLYKYYLESDFYMKYQNTHSYINKYRDEESILTINNSCIKLKTNMIKPDFFKYLSKEKNLFACDFENKDYFFLDNLILN